MFARMSSHRHPAPVSRIATLVLVLLFVCVPSAGAWTWPVAGPVLQRFTFDHAHPYAGGQHRGIDIGATVAGATVLAPAAGVVTFAGGVPASGASLTIETADGLSVTLTHLGSVAVARNDVVAEGAVVGSVGPSGTAEVSGPYVHLGIRTTADDQGSLDPLGLLPAGGPPAVEAPAPPAPPTPAPASQPASPATPAPAPPPAASAPPAPTVEQATASVPAPVASAAVAQPSDPVSPPVNLPTAQEPPAAGAAASVDGVRAAVSSADATAPVGAASSVPSAIAAVEATPAAAGLLVVRRASRPAAARQLRAAPQPDVLPGVTPFASFGAGARPPGSHAGSETRRARGAVPRSAHAPAREVAPRTVAARRPVRAAGGALVPGSPAVLRARSRRTIVPMVLALVGVALLTLGGLAASGVAAVRIIRSPSPTSEGARPVAVASEDPRRARVAVREWASPHRPRGGLRRAGGRVRALSPAQGQRRPDGQRYGRARNAGDGVRRPERRIAA